jgi:WD40-like Beta Propeller Repeat
VRHRGIEEIRNDILRNNETTPSLSPDGTQVAFAWRTESKDYDTIARLEKSASLGLALLPDEHYLLYPAIDNVSLNLMLVEKIE